MPTCPACKQEFRQRKNGACPLCNTDLQSFNGQYFRADLGSPTIALLRVFEKLQTMAMRKDMGPNFVYHTSVKIPLYRRELVAAERILTLYCDGDFDLAVEALNILFGHKKFSYKTRSTLGATVNDYPLAIAIAQAIRAEKAKAADKASDAIAVLDDREDIFN